MPPDTVLAAASGLVNTVHALPNLDGEIYLKAHDPSTERIAKAIENPANVNDDGTIDTRDLVLIP